MAAVAAHQRPASVQNISIGCYTHCSSVKMGFMLTFWRLKSNRRLFPAEQLRCLVLMRLGSNLGPVRAPVSSSSPSNSPQPPVPADTVQKVG